MAELIGTHEYRNPVTDDDLGPIDSMVAEFNQKVAEFERLVSWFRSPKTKEVAQTDAQLNGEVNDLLRRADLLNGSITAAKAKIAELQVMVDTMTPDWVRNFFGNGANAPQTGMQGNQLGAIPLLIGAAVAGAIAYLGAWISDAYIVGKKVEAQEAAIAAGADPTRTTETVFGSQESAGTMFGLGSIGTLGLLAAAGLAVWFFMNQKGGQ